MNKKVLLLGGNGYLGSRAYEHLISVGCDVTNVDMGMFGIIYPETIQVNYRTLTKEQLANYSHIVLLAAHSSVAMSVNNLYSVINNNVLNFIGLIDKLSFDQTLIYASTCAIYGNNPNITTEDTSIGHALNFYDYSKISTEEIARLYPNKKIIGLRLGSVNGFSKNMRKENLLNSLTLTSIQKEPLIISNGDAWRSVLGISDFCRALEQVIFTDTIKHRIYNITSVNDTIANFGKAVQKLSHTELIVNNKFTTDYSFNCSSALFERDFDFKFMDTVESIYTDLIMNHEKIVFNIDRTGILYE